MMTEVKTRAPAANRTPNDGRPANLLAVASGKGGVGKTWLAITLAHVFARQGKATLLFDGDLGLANVDVQLGLMPDRDLQAVISGQVTLAQARQRYEDGGFDIIAGRSGISSLASLPGNRLMHLREELLQLTRGYGQVIMDLGAGIDGTVRHLSAAAGTVLVVTTDEPTALTDAYAFIKLTMATVPGADVRIVVNMVENEKQGEQTYNTLRKACAKFLRCEPPLAGLIRRDRNVRDAIKSQMSVAVRSPNSPSVQDVEALAAGLIGVR